MNIRNIIRTLRVKFDFLPNASSVIADVEHKVNDLRAIAKSKKEEAQRCYDAANRYEDLGDTAVDEAAAASKLAANFARLLD